MPAVKKKLMLLLSRFRISMTKMGCRWLAFLLPLITTSQGNHEDTFRVTPLKSSTGVYYEYLGTIKWTTSTWRITIFMDINKIQNPLSSYKHNMNSLAAHCQPGYEEHCHQVIANHALASKLNLAEGLQRELMRETTMMEQRAEKLLPSHLPKAMRRRRATPLLGFLGGIIGPVAGLLTYDDGQMIEAKIEELNEAQTNISHLVGQQTHLVRSQLERMHKQAQQHQEKLESLKNELTNLNRELGQDTRKITELKYTESLTRVLRTNEAAVGEYIRAIEKILNVLHAARQKQMHPGLLTSRQLELIYRDIQDHRPEMVFPVSGPAVDIEELTSISTVTPIYRRGVLKILLDIPLLGRANYLVYQLHPLPVPQAILGNNSGKVYVLPKFSHIAVEESQRTYVLMNHQDVAACTELSSCRICKRNLPINENGKFRTCEAELLLSPSLSTFRICDVQITYKDQLDWKLLSTLGGWLYSLQEPIIATIVCLHQNSNQTELRGTGIVQLAPGCDLRIKGRMLPGTINQKGRTEIIYTPPLHLNLSELSSAVQELQGYTPVGKSMPDQTKEITTEDRAFEASDKSLEYLEQQLYELSLARRAGNNQTKLIHGSYLGLGIISTGLLIYLIYTRILKKFIACHPRLSPRMKADQDVNFSTIKGKQQNIPTTAENNQTISPSLASVDEKLQRRDSGNSTTQTSKASTDLISAAMPSVTPREKSSMTAVVQLPPQKLQPA